MCSSGAGAEHDGLTSHAARATCINTPWRPLWGVFFCSHGGPAIRLKSPWKPGQSGNPNGRPKRDMAAEIAKAIFENNAEMIYAAYTKMLRKGNAYDTLRSLPLDR